MERHIQSTLLRRSVPQPPGASETWLADDARELRAVQRWRAEYLAGTCTRIENYFQQHPDQIREPQLALRLIYEEACLREEQGEAVTLAEYQQRFPHWAEQLGMLWDCHELLSPTAADARLFPSAGETLGDFRLIAEIDRGAAGRVFLATQPSLSDRPMVLKITAHDGLEHLSLARLQHASIVPLYFVQDDHARRLRILCMPYLGGTSLARLLRHLENQPPARRQGGDICAALDACQSSLAASGEDRSPARKLFARSSYVDAVCWIGACLADALQHAHVRQLVHLDVKPSNVLIAGDGQPMLLDFHLAQPMLPAFEHPEGPLGGTPGYMSPEQAAAMEAVRARRPLMRPVDARSDIYALGTVLYECLTEQLWDAQRQDVPDLRSLNPAVSAGVEDVVRRCLERDPARRYPSAAALAEDLRRHMLNLPLQGVANRSSWERLRKWHRRRPYGLWAVFTAAALAVTLLSVTWGLTSRTSAAREALTQGRRMLAQHKYESATETLKLGGRLVRYVPLSHGLRHEIEGELRIARSMQLLDRLHRVADRLRFLDGLVVPHPDGLRAVSDRCEEVWQQRQQLQRAAQAVADPQLRDQFRRDLTDLAILWSDLRMRLAAGDERALHQQAMSVLEATEKLLGGSITLNRAREMHEALLGATSQERREDNVPPREHPWEQFAVGRWLMREGEYAEAQRYLEAAVELEPGSFWFHYYAGTCAYRLQQFDKALTEFSVCIALAPDSPECFASRAVVHRALEDRRAAAADVAQSKRLRELR